ncbi:MAG: hypothetical protein JSW50_13930 [Candidatus Latescibacterota bacterium]|nr:MAG: hypothetical protein JSW50_13930 [Candidatus Latescibacterota bacterium]
MNAKTVVTFILLAFVAVSVVYLVIDETRSPGNSNGTGPQSTGTESTNTQSAESKVVVYYFHGNKRCNTCRTIEAYTAEAVNSGFSKDIEMGRVEWRPVNIDEPENQHFVDDYELTTRTVVLVDVVEGREVRWTKLERVWDLTGDKNAFTAYIKDNTNTYLAEQDG